MNIKTKTTRTYSAFFTLVILLLFASRASAQATVASFSLLPKAQFFSSTGVPLAAGCIDFFATGTTNRQAIYADSTGLFQLANPLTLDAGGYAEVWGTNVGYDIIANTGVAGQTCATNEGSQLWKITNHNPFAVIDFGSNFIVASGTSDPSGSAGMLAYRTDLSCFRGFTVFWDCFVRLTDTQTLLNKTLTAATLNSPVVVNGATTGSPTLNGTPQPNDPATYANYPNAPIPGNTVANLMTLTSAPSQITAPATGATGGVVGVLVAGPGGGGTTGTIQSTGIANCNFDSATVAGDYVIPSLLTGGQCHDSGVVPPNLPIGTQCIGRVTVTTAINPTGGSPVNLGCDIKGGAFGAQLGCTAIGPVTITGVNTIQTLLSCAIPASSLAAGSLLEVDITGIESTASAQAITLTFNIGGGTVCQSVSGTTGVANNQPWNAVAKFSVLTSGAGGTANWSCGYASSASGGGVVGPNGVVGAPTIAINTTVSNTLLVQEQMSVANGGNSVTGQLLKAVIF